MRNELDAMAGEMQAVFLTAKLDAVISGAVDANREGVIETVIAWVRERPTAAHLELAAAAILHLGDRADAERFADVASAFTNVPAAEAIIADTRFAAALKGPT